MYIYREKKPQISPLRCASYAEKLEAAGVAVTRLHAPDMHHNFPVLPGTVARFPQCDAALNLIAGWLRGTLARGH
jgi:acetyl esterase